MATKRARTTGKKVKSLRAKSLSGKQAKSVKGGSGGTSVALKQGQASMGDGSAFKVQKV